MISTLDVQDGLVTVSDLTLLIQAAVGTLILSPEEFAQADFDDNGTVNIQVNKRWSLVAGAMDILLYTYI